MKRPDYYGFRSQRDLARRKSSFKGSLRLGVLFAVLLGINAYVFFFRGGTSIQDILKASAIQRQGGEAAAGSRAAPGRSGPGEGAPGDAQDGSLLLRGSMKGHLGLGPALAALELSASEVNELVEALRPELNMRALRPEHTFEVRVDPQTRKIRSFDYRVSPVTSVRAWRDADSPLQARREEVKLSVKRASLGGVVSASLISAMADRGEGVGLVVRFTNLFSWDLNWYVDPREGDQFRVIFEKRLKGDKLFRYGKVIAASYRQRSREYQAFLYKATSGKEAYYTPEGRAIQRSFLKMPLNFRRISSTFDRKRMHPVLHRTRGHYGVDYAAASGTPVWAASEGTVLRAGSSGGAGNLVQLEHASGVRTVYMHLSRFGQGIRPGVKVRQKQVIGYVGSTGLSTGPHLHYGITVGGRQVDPLTFEVGKGPLLPAAERKRFLAQLPRLLAELRQIPLRPAAAR